MTANKATLRKQKQRQRDAEAGMAVVQFKVTAQHKDSIENAASARGYDVNEYLALLTHRDSQKLEETISNLGSCDFCGEQLPKGCEGDVHKGRGECWKTTQRRKELSL